MVPRRRNAGPFGLGADHTHGRGIKAKRGSGSHGAHRTEQLDHSIEKANALAAEVVGKSGTDDRRFAHRATGASIHATDRLPVPVAAHLPIQLRELLRGIFHAGWIPSRVSGQIWLARISPHADALSIDSKSVRQRGMPDAAREHASARRTSAHSCRSTRWSGPSAPPDEHAGAVDPAREHAEAVLVLGMRHAQACDSAAEPRPLLVCGWPERDDAGLRAPRCPFRLERCSLTPRSCHGLVPRALVTELSQATQSGAG